MYIISGRSCSDISFCVRCLILVSLMLPNSWTEVAAQSWEPSSNVMSSVLHNHWESGKYMDKRYEDWPFEACGKFFTYQDVCVKNDFLHLSLHFSTPVDSLYKDMIFPEVRKWDEKCSSLISISHSHSCSFFMLLLLPEEGSILPDVIMTSALCDILPLTVKLCCVIHWEACRQRWSCWFFPH